MNDDQNPAAPAGGNTGGGMPTPEPSIPPTAPTGGGMPSTNPEPETPGGGMGDTSGGTPPPVM